MSIATLVRNDRMAKLTWDLYNDRKAELSTMRVYTLAERERREYLLKILRSLRGDLEYMMRRCDPAKS